MKNIPKKINVIDIECTCSEDGSISNEIIEIGITVLMAGRTDIIESSESIICKPLTQTSLTPFCTKLTTLTDDIVFGADSISFVEARDILKTKYDSYKNVFASWGQFDQKCIENNCKWHNIGYPFRSNMHLNIKALFGAKYGKMCGVEEAMEYLHLHFIGTPHRGIDDSYNIAAILHRILND